MLPIALAIALSIAPADAARVHVGADVLRLRRAPDAAAPPVGMLRIGAECRVLAAAPGPSSIAVR